MLKSYLIPGPSLPIDLYRHKMVQSVDKSSVYSIGGANPVPIKETLRKDEIYELNCWKNSIENCEWKFRHHLNNPRSDFVVVPLPEINQLKCVS